MVGAGKERRGRKIDHVVVWIEGEGDVVRNPEHAKTATDHGFFVHAVRKSEAWRELFLIQGKVIVARVWTGFQPRTRPRYTEY